MAGLSLEGIFSGVASIMQEAIKIRAKPREVPAGKRPAQGIALTDDPRVGKPARSIDLSRMSPPPVEASPTTSPDGGWSWHPVLQVVYGLFAGGRVREVVVEGAPPPDVELVTRHPSYPAAVDHPTRLSKACGVCLMLERQGLPPAVRELGERCPGCLNVRGHARDCSVVLQEYGIFEQDWQEVSGQGPNFDEFVEANRRRGYLPRGDEGPPW